MANSKRDLLNRRLSAMKVERESFIGHYKLLSEFMQPRRGRFFTSDRNKGERRHNSIINSRATKALRTATAGMFNGTMSPTRPWLALETDDPDLREFAPVKEWFFKAQQQMLRIFNASNLYNMAPTMITEELLFGTGCMSHVDDDENLARFYTHTVGSYVIAQDDRLVVNTVGREFEMTVDQIVSQFAESRSKIGDHISQAVRGQYDKGNYDSWFPVAQLIEPNREFLPGSLRSRRKKFLSTYYEPAHPDKDAVLSERGSAEFPVYCPRWELTGEDVYGTNCPGMTALGDTRQLQHEEKRKAQGIDKMVAPVMHGPPSLKNTPFANLPGFMNIYDAGGDQKGVRPVYEVKLPIGELVLDIEKVESRINEAFFVDLFRAISAMDGIQPRNQLELSQRNQERLLELGPVLERQYNDFLDPLVSRTFNQMATARIMPPPPPVLQGRPLRARYISTLALAQQSATTGNIDRFIGFVGGMSGAGFEEVLDKVDADEVVEEYAQLIGVPPSLIVPQAQADAARQARARAQQMAQSAEIAQSVAASAQAAGTIDLEGDNLASRVVENLSGGKTS